MAEKQQLSLYEVNVYGNNFDKSLIIESIDQSTAIIKALTQEHIIKAIKGDKVVVNCNLITPLNTVIR